MSQRVYYEENCHWCNRFLERGRGRMNYQDSRFCGADCRKKYHNARKKLKAQKEKMLEFIEFAQAMMNKGGDLHLDAGMVNDAIFETSRRKSGVKVYCLQCGQRRFNKPMPDEQCSFCGDSKWHYGELPKEESGDFDDPMLWD
jgi:ribosomal protein L24E